MSEQTQVSSQPQAPIPVTEIEEIREEPKTVTLLRALREMSGARQDPMSMISYIMLLRELRRMEREDQYLQFNPKPSNEDIKKTLEDTIRELNRSWEQRFMEYQHRIESLILGRKLEEAERRAKELEEKLKEEEDRRKQEETIKRQVEEKLQPLYDELSKLRDTIQLRLASMTENEKKSFLQSLGDQIEKEIGGEISKAIAGFIKDSIVKALNKEEGGSVVETTPQGKIDWLKTMDKWISRALSVAKAYVEKVPVTPPPMREIQLMPIQQSAQQTQVETQQLQAELQPLQQSTQQVSGGIVEKVPATTTGGSAQTTGEGPYPQGQQGS